MLSTIANGLGNRNDLTVSGAKLIGATEYLPAATAWLRVRRLGAREAFV